MKSMFSRTAAGTLFGSLLIAAAPLSVVSAMPMAQSLSTLTATVTYDSATLLFGGPGAVAENDIIVEVQSSVLNTDASASSPGTANATASATPLIITQLGFGESFALSFALDANAPLPSQAAASAALDSLITVTNIATGLALYTVDFVIDYEITTSASETTENAANQSGFATAGISVTSTDSPGSPLIDETFTSDTETGILTDGSGVLSAPFSFQLFDGEFRAASIFASGTAEASSVPVPASIFALGFGLLLMRRKPV